MYLIHGKGLLQTRFFSALLHPGLVLPLVCIVPDDGGGIGRNFKKPSVRVCFFQSAAIERNDAVFVQIALFGARNKTLPNAGTIVARGQWVRLRVPGIETADDRNVAGIGRPNAEIHAGLPFHFGDVAAEFLIDSEMFTSLKQTDIEVGEQAMMNYC